MRLRDLAAPLRARPRTAGAAAALLLVGGLAGGWMSANHVPTPQVHDAKVQAPVETSVIAVAAKPTPMAPAALQSQLEHLADAFGEPVGIAVADLDRGWTAEVAGDETFPQQSVSKLWVALAVLRAVDTGRLSLDSQAMLHKEDRSVFYQPLALRIRGSEGVPITIGELLHHALIKSDNAANDKLIAELGGAGVVAEAIARTGLKDVAVGGTERDLQTRTAGLEWSPDLGITWLWKAARAKLPDEVRDAALAAYLAAPPDGATPVGIVTALGALERGELLSRASTDFMLGLMAEARTGSRRLRGGLAPGWKLAHKTGTGPDWRGASVGINDVGLLTAPDGRVYAVAVMIRQTHAPVSARNRIMQGVTRAVAAQWAADSRLPAEGREVAGVDASAPDTMATGAGL